MPQEANEAGSAGVRAEGLEQYKQQTLERIPHLSPAMNLKFVAALLAAPCVICRSTLASAALLSAGDGGRDNKTSSIDVMAGATQSHAAVQPHHLRGTVNSTLGCAAPGKPCTWAWDCCHGFCMDFSICGF
jgi:hypothetical protein